MLETMHHIQERLLPDGRQTGSNPLSSVTRARWRRFFRCSLAVSNFRSRSALNLLMMPGEHVLWRDVADRAVQTNVVVMLT